jgi:hypothetical protein
VRAGGAQLEAGTAAGGGWGGCVLAVWRGAGGNVAHGGWDGSWMGAAGQRLQKDPMKLVAESTRPDAPQGPAHRPRRLPRTRMRGDRGRKRMRKEKEKEE